MTAAPNATRIKPPMTSPTIIPIGVDLAVFGGLVDAAVDAVGGLDGPDVRGNVLEVGVLVFGVTRK
jgi:hypothetical protein